MLNGGKRPSAFDFMHPHLYGLVKSGCRIELIWERQCQLPIRLQKAVSLLPSHLQLLATHRPRFQSTVLFIVNCTATSTLLLYKVVMGCTAHLCVTLYNKIVVEV